MTGHFDAGEAVQATVLGGALAGVNPGGLITKGVGAVMRALPSGARAGLEAVGTAAKAGMSKLGSAAKSGLAKLGSGVSDAVGRLSPSAKSAVANDLPVLEIDAGRMPNIAKNIQSALDDGHPDVLNRTESRELIAGNRADACRGFCGVGSPDEYPFASTFQGGAGARVTGVPIAEQRIQGGVMSQFYQKFGIGDEDPFRVVVKGLSQ